MTNINIKYVPPSTDTSDLHNGHWVIGVTWQFKASSITHGIAARSKAEPTINNVVALINSTLQEINNLKEQQ